MIKKLDMDIENTQYYEAGIAQGVTAGSLITLFICMLCWQCNRPPRRGMWYKVADVLY